MSTELPKSPYRGMKSFRYADRKIYAGRDTEIDKIYKLLLLFRGVLVYGNSGVGKSSLISAGLIPKLFERNFTPEIIRLNPDNEGTFVVTRIKKMEEDNSYSPSLFAEYVDNSITD